MFSLLFYSLFFREIKIGKWQNLPQNLANLSQKIINGEQVVGKVFRPAPQKSLFITILMTGLFVSFFVWLYAIGKDISFFNYIFMEAWWLALLFLFFVIYFFYHSLLSNLIFPIWLKKNLNHYFIYIGPEGILRKDYFRACFIPWSIVTGSNMYYVVAAAEEGSSLSLDLYLKNHKVWTPMLVNAYSYGSIWYGLVTYDMKDMNLIAQEINFYAKEIGFKQN